MACFNKEARASYMRHADSLVALWSGNFRGLSVSVARMATLADAGRITDDVVGNEIERLKR